MPATSDNGGASASHLRYLPYLGYSIDNRNKCQVLGTPSHCWCDRTLPGLKCVNNVSRMCGERALSQECVENVYRRGLKLLR